MTKKLSITKERDELTTLVDRADRMLDEYIITVNGSPAAAIISAAEYDSWKETNEILNDKQLMKSIKKSEKEFKEGKWEDWEDVKKQLKINV